jgi:hypothetical protein
MALYDKASLVLIPSGTKEGVVFSQKPTNGDGDFTFSRATAATRVNADGLIEKETQNLLFPSEGTTTGWIATGIGTNTSSILTGQQDPNGGTQGYRWTATCGATTSDRAWYRKNITSGGEVYTFSFWVKSATGSDQNLGFHFSGGTGTPLTATSSWQRVERYGTTGAGTAYFGIEIRGTLTDQSADVYIYGMQLEYGLVARDYIETTTAAVYGGITDNVPRLDYTDSSCPALLLEPQRTNLFTNSEYFGGTDWTKGNSSITNNTTTSPSGFVDGSFLVPNTSLGVHTCGQSVGITSGTYTLSVYAKQGGYKNLLVWFDTYSGGVGVNLDDLSVFRDQNNDGYTIEDFGNGWVRIAVTITASSAADPNFYVYSNAATPAITYAGDGTSGIYLYGAQLEAGSYATSYIPTYGTSVTRVADAASKTGISSLIGQTEGTMFVEYEWEQKSGVHFVTDLSDGTTNNEILISIGNTADNQIRFQIQNSGVSVVIFNSSAISSGTHKTALAYANNDVVAYLDGALVDTDTSATIPATSRLAFERANGTLGFVGEIKQSILFKTRLSNEELADLTTI